VIALCTEGGHEDSKGKSLMEEGACLACGRKVDGSGR